jgi:hypothetical protein
MPDSLAFAGQAQAVAVCSVLRNRRRPFGADEFSPVGTAPALRDEIGDFTLFVETKYGRNCDAAICQR